MKLSTIEKNVEITDTCWLWTGFINANGYGVSSGNSAHRKVWEALVGPIPEGLELDHLCRVRNCVNPDHLEPVTHAENLRRGERLGGPTVISSINAAKTHCPQGHPYDEANTIRRYGRRYCRPCKNAHDREYRRQGRRS